VRIARFILWILAVIGTLVDRLGIAIHWISLAVIFVLLCTTPGNAIRLPRFFSEIFIIAAMIALHPPGLRWAIALLLLIVLRIFRKSPWWAVFAAWK